MSTEKRSVEDVCVLFNNLKWHDSKLIGYSVYPSADGKAHDVCFDIQLVSASESGIPHWIRRKLILHGCTILKSDLDLDGKRICDDSIADAYCAKESKLKSELEHGQLQYENVPLADYLHFRILLIAPGGEINAFAQEFELRE